MSPGSQARPFLAPGSPQYSLVRVAQALLRQEMARALHLGAGDRRILEALSELSAGLTVNPRALMARVFTRADLEPPSEIYTIAASLVTNRAVMAFSDPVVRPAPAPDANGSTRRGSTGSLRRGSEDRAGSPRYHLTVYLTRVVADALTPGPTADEFRVTGGYTYHGVQNASGVAENPTYSMTAWEHSFSDSDTSADSNTDHLPHMLFSQPIAEGEHQLMMTLTPTEEDVMSAQAAQAVGKLGSLLMTIGVDLLIGLAMAAGHALAPGTATLTPEAQKLIRDYAVPGVVGLIQEALGPELFRMPQMRVNTPWTPGTPVSWRSWSWYADQRTTPHAGNGAGTHNGTDIKIDQIEIMPDQHNVLQQTVVSDGGVYKLDVQFVMTEV